MIRVNRWVMGIPGLFFAAYQAFLGYLALPYYQNPIPAIVSIVLYLTCCILSVLAYKGLTLPWYQTALNILVAAAMPLLINPQIKSISFQDHITWYVEAVAAILAVVAIRRHRRLAYFGLIILWAEVLLWAGAGVIFTSGLIGATLLVFVGTATSLGFNHLDTQIERVQAEERMLVKRSVMRQVATAARVDLVNQNLHGAWPYIEKIATAKKLTAAEMSAVSKIAERIRYSQAGGRLVDEQLVEAISRCQERGAEVQLAVGNALDHESHQQLVLLRQRILQELETVEFGRVIIRSFIHAQYRIQFMVTMPGEPRPLRSVRF